MAKGVAGDALGQVGVARGTLRRALDDASLMWWRRWTSLRSSLARSGDETQGQPHVRAAVEPCDRMASGRTYETETGAVGLHCGLAHGVKLMA